MPGGTLLDAKRFCADFAGCCCISWCCKVCTFEHLHFWQIENWLTWTLCRDQHCDNVYTFWHSVTAFATDTCICANEDWIMLWLCFLKSPFGRHKILFRSLVLNYLIQKHIIGMGHCVCVILYVHDFVNCYVLPMCSIISRLIPVQSWHVDLVFVTLLVFLQLVRYFIFPVCRVMLSAWTLKGWFS